MVDRAPLPEEEYSMTHPDPTPKALRGAIGALALLVLVTGCAPVSGVVTDRKQDVSCFKGGAIVNCDPVWKIQVTDRSRRDPVYTDRPEIGWIDVDEETYERCRQGTEWPACKGVTR